MEELDQLAAKTPPLNQIVLKAADTMRLLEGWTRVETSNEQLKVIVQGVQRLGRCFYDGLDSDTSVAVAQRGYNMAGDAEFLLQTIGGEFDVQEMEIKELLSDMIVSAKVAHAEALQLQEHFQAIRVEAIKQNANTRAAVTDLQKKKTTALGAAKESSDGADAAVFLTAVGIGISSVFFPPLIPFVAALGTGVTDQLLEDAKAFEAQGASLGDAQQAAERLTNDLLELTVSTGDFVAWWGDVVASLEYLQTNQERLLESGAHSRAKKSVKVWKEIKDSYSGWKNNMRSLQDQFHRIPLVCGDSRSHLKKSIIKCLEGAE